MPPSPSDMLSGSDRLWFPSPTGCGRKSVRVEGEDRGPADERRSVDVVAHAAVGEDYLRRDSRHADGRRRAVEVLGDADGVLRDRAVREERPDLARADLGEPERVVRPRREGVGQGFVRGEGDDPERVVRRAESH